MCSSDLNRGPIMSQVSTCLSICRMAASQDALSLGAPYGSLLTQAQCRLSQLLVQYPVLMFNRVEVKCLARQHTLSIASVAIHLACSPHASAITPNRIGPRPPPMAVMPNCSPTPVPARCLGVFSMAHACSTERMA